MLEYSEVILKFLTSGYLGVSGEGVGEGNWGGRGGMGSHMYGDGKRTDTCW